MHAGTGLSGRVLTYLYKQVLRCRDPEISTYDMVHMQLPSHSRNGHRSTDEADAAHVGALDGVYLISDTGKLRQSALLAFSTARSMLCRWISINSQLRLAGLA